MGVDKWDIYQTDEVATWLRELQNSDPKTAGLVDDAIYAAKPLRTRAGPAARRHHHQLEDLELKELRPGSRGRSEVRILFVFDPWRSAILLVAGDKAGNWNRWYTRMIPRAEQLYEKPEGTGSGGRRPVTSYTKWDRDVCIERVGGPEEAERRRKALMARQSGQRLAEERKQRGLTQAQLAETMGVTPGGLPDRAR